MEREPCKKNCGPVTRITRIYTDSIRENQLNPHHQRSIKT